MANITTTWKLDGFVDEQRYYRSETPIDIENLPPPTAILSASAREYEDTVLPKKAYYVAFSSLRNNVEKISEIRYLGDKYWNNVVFYCRLNGNTTDLSNYAHTPITIGSDVSYSATGARFGQALFVDNNINQCITYPSTNFGFAANEDFTIEAWTYCTSKPTGFWYSAFGSWVNGTGWCLFYTPQGIAFNFRNIGLSANIAYSTSQLHAIAVTRKDSIIRLFFNGNIVATMTDNGAIASNDFRIGGNLTSTDWWRGYVDDIRITKGVARYTSNYNLPIKEFYDF